MTHHLTIRGRVILAAAAAAAVFGLSGCAGLGQAGAAATVGDTQISTEDLTASVDAVQEQRGEIPGEPDLALVTGTLQRKIITELVDLACAEQGVNVTQGEVDLALLSYDSQFGGRDAVVQAFLESGVPADEVQEQARLSLQVQALGAALVPDADQSGQQQAVVQYVTGFGLQTGVDVSPRFGTWDPLTLQLGPTPTDLAAPLLTPLSLS